jgi:hypothetical protein
MRYLWVMMLLVLVRMAVAQDVTPPAVSVTAPVSGAMVSGSTVPLRATATDAVGVVSIEFTLNGNTFSTSSACCGTASTTRQRLVTLDTTVLTNGVYTIRAIAQDAAGNSTTSAARSFTVANPIESNPTNVSITANATIVFLGNPTGVSISADATIVFLGNPSNVSMTIP